MVETLSSLWAGDSEDWPLLEPCIGWQGMLCSSIA